MLCRYPGSAVLFLTAHLQSITCHSLGVLPFRAKVNSAKNRSLAISGVCGAAAVYVAIPRSELFGNSILRVLVAPPTRQLLPPYPYKTDGQYVTYMRSIYGQNWEPFTSVEVPRGETLNLVISDLRLDLVRLDLVGPIFLGVLIAFTVYKLLHRLSGRKN